MVGSRRVLVGVATVVAMLAIGVPRAAAAIDWHSCSSAAHFQCGSLQVPLDYDSPNGPQISVGLIRRPATDQEHRLGSLVWNPGGPGGAGTVELPFAYDFVPPQARARFDIVSFDPRGIGETAQLQCFATQDEEDALLAQLPPAQFPDNPEETQRSIDVYSQFDRACAEHGGPIQDHMSTANTARDMDRLRAALGESRLNYYGPSYGSYLGTTYANLFPSRVGRIVLDGNVPPVEWNDAKAGATMNTFGRIQSPRGGETALKMMLSECGKVDTSRCAFSAGSPEATSTKYSTLLDRLRVQPVTLDDQTYTWSLTVASVASGIQFQNATPAIGVTGWKELADLLQSLWNASSSASASGTAPTSAQPLIERRGVGLAPRLDPELLEGTYGVLCSESPNPTDPTSYNAQGDQLTATQSPFGQLGRVWAWIGEPCAEWRGRDADRYTGPWNRFTSPYLLIGTLGDPNTAYVGTQRLAAEVPNSRILTESGGGHTAFFNKSDCIDGFVDSYLVTGTLPPAGTVCDQNQAPF
jgi:pimeloyl-ACP methyl ester carboxylesterase